MEGASSYRRVELFGLVVALAAVYQKVDVVRVGSDGVRQVSFRQLVPANKRSMNKVGKNGLSLVVLGTNFLRQR